MSEIEEINAGGWRSKAPYSPAVKAGGFIFVAGHVPVDPISGATVGEDVETQTRQTIENIRRTLAAAGVGLERIVKTTVFVTSMDEFWEMNEVYREFFKDPLPARSAVEVTRLARPEFKVEIEAVALA